MSTVRSSLLYQLLLHINRPYAVFFYVAEILFVAYKGTALPYPSHVFTLEILLVLLFGPIEALRIAWGTRGNLTETSIFVAFSLLLSAANIALCVYLGVFQSYVLLLEEIFICIEFGLLVIETIVGIVLMATLSRPR